MKQRVFCILLLLCTVFVLSSCEKAAEYDTQSYYNMDTVITVQLPPGDNSTVFDSCGKLIDSMEQKLSKTVTDSEISKCNQTDEPYSFSSETASIIRTALKVSTATDGAYSLSIAPLSDLWGDVYRAEKPALPNSSAIEAARALVNDTALTLDGCTLTKTNSGLQIELGGCAKGYACEQTVDYLQQHAEYGYVSFGGNIGVFGKKPDGTKWKIGIKDALHPDSICGSVEIDGGYISVSGDYERFAEIDGKRYHHIIDNKTGYPAESGLHSVAVYADDGTLADTLSTALFVLGYEKSMAFYKEKTFSFEAIFTLSDGTVRCTPGIADAFTPTHETTFFTGE